MTLRQLKWLTILAPPVFMFFLETVRVRLFPDLLNTVPGQILVFGVTVAAGLFFAEAVFSVIGRIQDRVLKQNQELLALHQAGLDISGELALETVLQKVVDQARHLIGARYGALSLLREGGGIGSFLTAGITPEQRAAIGPIPRGHGLLAVVLTEGQRLRLANVARDPHSVGFPPHHPAMRTLLAVPIMSRGSVLGNLYLADKDDQSLFTAANEETLTRFATQAALAIENARLHSQVRELAVVEERERIAREMHDSLAQVLGYVNTKSQAAEEFLRSGQPDRAAAQIGQLAEAARSAYADVREGILGLRTSLAPERGFLAALQDYLARWEDQSGVALRFVTQPAEGFTPGVTPMTELQLLRVIQEALTNIRKHAVATEVNVTLSQSDGRVVATIEDNGIGLELGTHDRPGFPRFGLSTMRERAEAVNGVLEITSTPGKGTKVTVRVPVAGNANAQGGAHAGADR